MLKKLILSAALMAGAGSLFAQTVQPCGATEAELELRRKYPEEIAKSEAKWKAIIEASMKGVNIEQYAKITQDGNNLTKIYHIPLVFHIIHEYGTENITDNAVYKAVSEINALYSKMNDTSTVLPAFRGKIRGTNTDYIGNTKFVFHLASKDPQGRPTNGITRRRNYITLRGGDFGKLDGWAPENYMNIWVNRNITTIGAAAYAYQPPSVDNPAGRIIDGVMIGYAASNSDINNDNTTGHELGHSFGLAHPWGNTNSPQVACGDDGVDDTPPTKGHNPIPSQFTCTPTAGNAYPALFDTACVYTPAAIGKLNLDTTSRFTLSAVNAGPTFSVYTPTWLDSVRILPAAAIGSPFTIEVRRGNTVVKTYSDTVSVAMGTVQRIPLILNLAPSGDYKMVFTVNPGMYSDTVKQAFTAVVPGALQITSDTALNKRYTPFYRYSLRYGYFKFYDSASYKALYLDTANLPGVIVNQQNPVEKQRLTDSFAFRTARYFPGAGFLVDYPDTSNSQNVMDYTYCSKMFTNGQSTRMRLAAASPIAGRNNLSTDANLKLTGVADANGVIYEKHPDTPPVADFSINRFTQLQERIPIVTGVFNTPEMVYKNIDKTFTFRNQSWGDTISSVNWSFSNNASTPTSTSTTTVTTSFGTPGWATVTLVANSNAGSDTEARQAVYVADKNNPIAPIGYFQDFNPGGDRDKWPIFNYYNNAFKWQVMDGIGVYDNNCISYRSFDPRLNTTAPPALSLPGSTPDGDYDDFYSAPFDVSSMATGNCNLNFHYAGASRSTNTFEIRDLLTVFASIDGGDSWYVVDSLSKARLNNNGAVAGPFTPQYNQWATASLDLRPIVQLATAGSDALKSMLFRFRYRPGAETNVQGLRLGTGNNFYMDRIHISNNPVGVNDQEMAARGVSLVPNPTNGSSSVVVKNAKGNVSVVVTDITGKVVYITNAQSNGAFTQIDVPATSLQVKGIYLVQISSEGIKQTEKLVVY